MDFHEDQRREALNYRQRAINTNENKYSNYVNHLINMPRMVPQGSLNMMTRHSANDVYGWGETPYNKYLFGGARTQEMHEYYQNQLKKRATQLEEQALNKNNYFLGGLPTSETPQNSFNQNSNNNTGADESSKISLELYFNELIDGGFSGADISKENARKAIGNLNRIGLTLSKSDLDRYEKILSEILDKFIFQARNPSFNIGKMIIPKNSTKSRREWEAEMKPLLQNIEGIEGVYKIYLIILSLQQSWGQDNITRENIFTQQFNEIIKANPVELLPTDLKKTVKNVRDYIRENNIKISNLIKSVDDSDNITPFKGYTDRLYQDEKNEFKNKTIKYLASQTAKEMRRDNKEEDAELLDKYDTKDKLTKYISENISDYYDDTYITSLTKKIRKETYQKPFPRVRQNKTLPDSTVNKDMKETEAKIIEKNRRDGEAADTKREDIKRGRERQEQANVEYEEKLINDFYRAVDELTARISPEQAGKNHNLVISIDTINELNVDELYELNDAIEYAFKLFRELRIYNNANVFRNVDGYPYERPQDATRIINTLRRKQGNIATRIRELQEPEPEPQEAGQIERKEGDGEDDTEELEGQGAIRINTKRRYKKRKSPKSKPKPKKTNKNKKIGGANLGALLL